MLDHTKILLATAIIVTTLTACDKKEPAKTETKNSASTTTTTVTTTSNTATSSTAASSTSTSPIAAAVASSPAVATPAPIASATSNAQSTITQPAISDSKSIVTQAVIAGTPEATVKNAMDAMMNGTAKQAASYYQVDIPDFDKVLAEQQPQVKQQLKHLELGKTAYNKDNTKAFIVGKLTTAASPTPQTVSYKLIKVNGEWKLVE